MGYCIAHNQSDWQPTVMTTCLAHAHLIYPGVVGHVTTDPGMGRHNVNNNKGESQVHDIDNCCGVPFDGCALTRCTLHCSRSADQSGAWARRLAKLEMDIYVQLTALLEDFGEVRCFAKHVVQRTISAHSDSRGDRIRTLAPTMEAFAAVTPPSGMTHQWYGLWS